MRQGTGHLLGARKNRRAIQREEVKIPGQNRSNIITQKWQREGHEQHQTTSQTSKQTPKKDSREAKGRESKGAGR